ncbi:hypothetical protein [Tropicimonas marinistellae]|uniref:hypothetical protein n=1 Tax=Tropicimonas marinistellae TaxID=1739787 RepID=UPI00082DDBD4|nr:hypothetical protein [Tropicimonas marinistellae]
MPHIARLHAASGTLALTLIATFWLSTVVAEIIGNTAMVATVKAGILFGFVLLVPALATAGATGTLLARGWKGPRVGAKRRRMAIAATNGLLVLIPSAMFLSSRATAGNLDAAFYVVQGLELVCGAINIILLGRNLRDGLSMRRRA